jgi:hypothetical protein
VPRGEPTKAVRLPIWLVEHLTPQAERAGCTVPELITKRMAPQEPVGRPDPTRRVDGNGRRVRCTCSTPTLSKVVTNLCTTCHQLR